MIPEFSLCCFLRQWVYLSHCTLSGCSLDSSREFGSEPLSAVKLSLWVVVLWFCWSRYLISVCWPEGKMASIAEQLLEVMEEWASLKRMRRVSCLSFWRPELWYFPLSCKFLPVCLQYCNAKPPAAHCIPTSKAWIWQPGALVANINFLSQVKLFVTAAFLTH